MYSIKSPFGDSVALVPHVKRPPVLVWSHDQEEDHELSRRLSLAYCAGLFDGDGCITISKTHTAGRKNPTYRLCLSLVQNCFVTIRRFQSVFDINSSIIDLPRTVQQNRQVYDLRYDGTNALQVLTLIRPYLVRKSAEADVAAQFIAQGQMSVHPGPKGTAPEIWKVREQHYRKLRALK